MADNRTPPMEQSAAAIVDMMHNISRDGLPQGPQLGIVIAPPPEIQIKLNNIVLTKKEIYITKPTL